MTLFDFSFHVSIKLKDYRVDCGFLWEPELRKFTDWVTNSHIEWYILWCNLTCFKFWRNVWILWFSENMLCYFFMICNRYLRTEIAVSLFDWNSFEKCQDYICFIPNLSFCILTVLFTVLNSIDLLAQVSASNNIFEMFI